MRYSLFILLAGALLAAGCVQPQMSMTSHEKPAVPAEMAKLEAWLGTWTGTAEMVTPSPEEMKKMMGPGAADMPTTFKGEETFTKVLGGMFLREEGWHDMGGDQRASYVSYITWDPVAKKYRSWYFGDWDGFGEGWMTPAKDGKSWKMEYASTDPKGAKSTGGGTMTFLGEDKMEWTWAENGPHGKMEMKGTSVRQSK